MLEREDIERMFNSFLYFNLLGMSVRHLNSGESRARAAYEKALNHRSSIVLIRFIILLIYLKDEDQERADQLYFRSLQLNAGAQSVGTTMVPTSLTCTVKRKLLMR